MVNVKSDLSAFRSPRPAPHPALGRAESSLYAFPTQKVYMYIEVSCKREIMIGT